MMKKFAFFWVVFVILAFQVGPLAAAQADVVGRLTQVDGRVDLLKGGKLPATPVKLNDGVQIGDVLRTKSQSKAQITFTDNSVMTISPESRVGIEAYMVDSTQNKRNAVVQLFQGLAHVVVNKVFKAAEPDFVVKTPTAVMGVRGTDFGVRIYPITSEILNFEGLLQVGNILPRVSQLFHRAFKLAYSFGPEGGGQHWVFLKAMQGTMVGRGQPPGAVFGVTPQMMNTFMQQINNLGRKGSGGSAGGVTGSGGGGPAVDSGVLGAGGPGSGSRFLGVNEPGAGGAIPLITTISGNPVGVVTPPKVLPATLPVPTTTTTTPTPASTLPPFPPR
jgi:hypothetical protein